MGAVVVLNMVESYSHKIECQVWLGARRQIACKGCRGLSQGPQVQGIDTCD